ncbi:hypothetical protein DYL61_13705 [Pseudomonas nabeulensis]|uniref:Uncharacterized protein n=1 Tax=Pseudomonas nabeulensis TaxID=2293833 RepID=A0A4Z0B584_9PSED|nr:hypothetical protein DYL61_13705 [Pseudomonas nabeulensis]
MSWVARSRKREQWAYCKSVKANTVLVARELAPAGPRSGPSSFFKRLGLLRSPTGASSLATGYFYTGYFLIDCY